jgi:hypothetical protein
MRLVHLSPSSEAIAAPTSSSFADAKKNPVTADPGRRGGEALWKPAFRGTVFRSGTEAHPRFGRLTRKLGGERDFTDLGVYA